MISFIRHAAMGLWSVLCITSSFVVMSLTVNRKLAVTMARKIWAPGILWICGVKLDVRGLRLFDSTKPLIFVSNHQSYMDIPCLFRAIRSNLYFTAKSQLKRLPFVGWYMALTGMIFIDRSNKQKAIASIDKAGDLIKRGRNVIIFPEGRRSLTGSIGPFKRGAFHLAMKSQASIIPIAINGTGNVWFKKRFRLKPGRVSVAIGEPISAGEYTEKTIQQLVERIRNEVIRLQGAPVPA